MDQETVELNVSGRKGGRNKINKRGRGVGGGGVVGGGGHNIQE